MIPSFELVNSILKTLPISYYIGRKVDVILSKDTDISYADLMFDKIVISYNQISRYDIPDTNVETYIRTMLYHEVSHTLLTPIPKKLNIDPDIYNMFEDERIERLTDTFYIGIDYKKLLEVISPYKIPLTDKEMFFNKIRYRDCSDKENEYINFIIKKHSHLRFNPSPQDISEYINDIKALCDNSFINQDFNKLKIESPDGSEPSLPDGNSDEGNDLHIDLNTTFAIYDNLDFRQKVKAIFESRRFERGLNENSKVSYNGKIRPKQIGRPNDTYKWWVNNGDGFIKNKKHLCLNLFIDQSGSFKSSENIVNSILKELINLEKEYYDFSFQLITIDNDIRLEPCKRISCNGSNSLTSKVGLIKRQVIKPDNQNINIILFNGNAIDKDVIDPITNQLLKAYSEDQAKQFVHFNMPNTIIISDLSNKTYLDKYCYNTKRIYTNEYVKELENNILLSLQSLIY